MTSHVIRLIAGSVVLRGTAHDLITINRDATNVRDSEKILHSISCTVMFSLVSLLMHDSIQRTFLVHLSRVARPSRWDALQAEQTRVVNVVGILQ